MNKTLKILSLSLLTSLASFSAYATDANSIEVTNPYAREVPPGAPASASFMNLANNSDSTIKLVGASSKSAEIVELHTHTNDNGVMRMRKIDSIEIPANSEVSLQPGGHHIMLINPVKALKADQTIEVTLVFADDTTQTVKMPVKSLKKMMRQQMQMNSHEHNHEQMMNHHNH